VGSRIHRSGYAVNELVLGQLEESHSLIAIHDWEVPQEIVERVAFFDIVKKRLNGNPCACEARHPMHDSRINRDHLCDVRSLLGRHVYSLGQVSAPTAGWLEVAALRRDRKSHRSAEAVSPREPSLAASRGWGGRGRLDLLTPVSCLLPPDSCLLPRKMVQTSPRSGILETSGGSMALGRLR
jgi:hypothetical protein